MHGIFYNGRLLAQVGANGRVLLEPGIGALDRGDPLRRFAVAMAMYACDVDAGEVPGPYQREAAERYARALLMPADEIAADLELDDAALAARWSVPVEQAGERREDLARASARQ